MNVNAEQSASCPIGTWRFIIANKCKAEVLFMIGRIGETVCEATKKPIGSGGNGGGVH